MNAVSRGPKADVETKNLKWKENPKIVCRRSVQMKWDAKSKPSIVGFHRQEAVPQKGKIRRIVEVLEEIH